jgi:hypothetical protein
MKSTALRSMRDGVMAALVAMTLVACDSVNVEEQDDASGQTLCVADYEMCINPIFDANLNSSTGPTTCSASGCHDQSSGSGGAFKIFSNATPGSTEMLANFFAAKAFANLDNSVQSKLLLEPLRGISSITGTHTGGDILPDTGDACYVAMQSWISTRVDDTDSSSCGFCTPPSLGTCGF